MTMESTGFQRTQMQKERIIETLKQRGCRITKQRLALLDIILNQDCSCCKEIYYQATKIDPGIGKSTVYRMVNMLEEIGAISRKNMYKVAYDEQCAMEDACTIVLDSDRIHHLSARKWNAIVKAGLRAYGYMDHENITSITIKPCQCSEGC